MGTSTLTRTTRPFSAVSVVSAASAASIADDTFSFDGLLWEDVSPHANAETTTEPSNKKSAPAKKEPEAQKYNDEELSLLRAMKNDNTPQTRNALMMAHMGLVRQIARRYAIDASHFEDIVQEGCLGVIRAAETFDLSYDVRFSTYATYWIRTRIQRYLAGVRSHEYGAPASVAWACGKTRGKDGFRALTRSLSLEEKSSSSSDRLVEDLIPVADCNPEADVASREMHVRLMQALRSAARKLDDPRTKVIIEARLLTDEPATLAQVGEALNLSREGARLLESRLLKQTRKELEGLAGSGIDAA